MMTQRIKFYVDINIDLCKECGICIEFCPIKILETSIEVNKYGYHYTYVKNMEKCIGCKLCEKYCPEFAIYVRKLVS